MTKKNWFLIVVFLALTATYVYFFTDWFKPKTIQIFHTSPRERPNFRRRAGRAAVQTDAELLMFGFNRTCKLTEIKVVPLAEWQTNHTVLPVWHLISDSNSVPLKFFVYGQHIRGLKPAVPGAHAEPLQPNVTYRLFVAAGSFKGQHDFQAKPSGG